jgi:hypothetical protein
MANVRLLIDSYKKLLKQLQFIAERRAIADVDPL